MIGNLIVLPCHAQLVGDNKTNPRFPYHAPSAKTIFTILKPRAPLQNIQMILVDWVYVYVCVCAIYLI